MEQGGLGDAFFLVVEGSVALIAFGPEGERVHLCTQSEGYYFGEVWTPAPRPSRRALPAVTPCPPPCRWRWSRTPRVWPAWSPAARAWC